MAASSKPSAVHFTLVFFILLSAILGVMYWVTYRNLDEKLADLKKAKDESTADKAATNKVLDQLEAVKKVAGLPFPEVGETDPKPNTAIGDANNTIAKNAPEVQPATLTAAVNKLNEEKTTASSDRDSALTNQKTTQKEYTELDNVYKAKLAEQTTARTKADTDLADLAKKKEEEIAQKLADIETLKKEIASAQAELGEEKDAHAKTTKELNQRVTFLKIINERLQGEIDGLRKTSFEAPDGNIRWVDHEAKLVWINLGSADNLHTRTTFSVYTRNTSGVASDTKDIKGAIEVTLIRGPHEAEARIIKEDIYRPMAKGDPVYTPLWSPGGTEQFAFVGKIDIDGDGIDDRDRLHEVIGAARARISNEVDDKGVLYVHGKVATEPEINEETKFLVLGTMPEMAEAALPEERDVIKKIFDYRKKMMDAAREHAVRPVKLSDFLSYIGYVPERRLFRPGEEGKFMLRAGAHSTGTSNKNSISTGRKSTGTTADVYSGDKNIKAKSSTGSTAKVFRAAGK